MRKSNSTFFSIRKKKERKTQLLIKKKIYIYIKEKSCRLLLYLNAILDLEKWSSGHVKLEIK